MRRSVKWLLYIVSGITAAGIVLLWAGGAINWNRQAPYEMVRAWGERGSGEGQFNDPTGIAVTDDEVFVADARNGRIQVFDKNGVFRRAFGQERLGRPMNLTIVDDRLYVPDYFKDVIHVFRLDGSIERTMAIDDGLNSPGGVAVRADGSLLVADTYGQRVVQIGNSGEVLRSWEGKGVGPARFNYPTDVAAAGDGFFVADGYNDRIQAFDADGNFERKWGGPFGLNVFGPFKGWFATVTSIAAGPNGDLFAADFYNDRIQKFTAEGRFLTAFGTPSAAPGHTEIAVAVDADGAVWTANFSANRVEQWRERY